MVHTAFEVGECAVGVAAFLAPEAKIADLILDADRASTAIELGEEVGVATPLAQFVLDLKRIQDDGIVSFSQLKATLEDAHSLPDFLHNLASLLGSLSKAHSGDVSEIALDVADLTGLGPCVELLAKIPAPSSSQSVTVSVTNPGNQVGTVGVPVSLQIHATDTDGGTLSYTASGLPAGLTIDPSTGLITGTPTTAGSPSVTVTARDATGPVGNTTFTWTINLPVDTGTTKATEVSAGTNFSCALSSIGSVDCWGDNYAGDLGDATSSGPDSCPNEACSTTPVQVSGIADATQVSAGSDSTACALLSGGGIDCWGYATAGELGDGSNTGPDACPSGGGQVACSTTPVAVTGISDATQVVVGTQDACALLSGGTVDCWGYNGQGALGNGSTAGDGNDTSADTCGVYDCWPTPTAVSGITNAIQITAGTYDACALLSTGSIDCWGDNGLGDLGDGTSSSSDLPEPVTGITDATQLATGIGEANCALVASGSIECWGASPQGELGNGTVVGADTCASGTDTCDTTPVPVSVISDAVQVSAGGDDTCGLLSTGGVECWGNNQNGQLGNGTLTGPDACYLGADDCAATPQPVAGLSGVTQISVGSADTCALLSSGGVDCWGV